MENNISFDAAPSARTTDANGFLHVANSHITKAIVNPYYGREIPGWQAQGLEANRIYYGLRDPRELQKSIGTWEGLPLHIEHHPDSADEPEKLTRVGAVGKAFWANPYVDAGLTVWDRKAIDAIEDGSFRELSCAYRYDPDFTPGQYEGVDYDFVMRNIRGNHVALVEEGRAGPDVVVADARLGKDADKWITVKPNGAQNTGRPCLIDGETGQIKAGMGGKFNGRNIDDIQRGKNPHPVTEEKYQARQKRQAEKQKATHASPAANLSDKDLDARMKHLGEFWGSISDEEKEEFWALKREFETRRKKKNEELDRKRQERLNSPEFQEAQKRAQQEAERRAHVRQRESEITTSTYERAQKALRKPLDDALKRKLEQWSGLKFSHDSTPASNSQRPSRTRLNTSLQHPKATGGIMGKFKNWFHGAKDSDPATERNEVDLAQAIIDLHKVDPNTGEIVDVNEDEDKAAEVRKVVEELSGKLSPEEIKRLTQALDGLAYAKATGDEDPAKAPALDEELKNAMDACGLDSDDEDTAKAFAEGVKFGNANAQDEDTDETGMKKAMGACGVDADDPQESRAFAEGMKFAEGKAADEEAAKGVNEPAAADDDKASAVARVLDSVQGLTPDQRGKLQAGMLALFGASATDEDLPAQDRALRKFGRRAANNALMAKDAMLIQARAMAGAQKNMRKIASAVRDVRSLVGELDFMAFDSAQDVYGYTLEQCGINPHNYVRAAWRGMVDMLRREKAGLSGRRMTQDEKLSKLDGPFAGMGKINLG